jgi:O-antigen/teichoic acid export membrane protein
MRSRITLANMGLRLSSLVGKFLLSLYLAKYLSLEDLGIYGIITGFQMIAVVFFGVRADHVFTRTVAVAGPEDARASLRDQSLFYAANYLLSVPLLAIAWALVPQPELRGVLLFGWVICVAESYANLLFNNTNALGRSTAANALFFVRAGLWAFVAVACGLIWPELRTLEFVLGSWVTGSVLSIALNLVVLRARQWPSLGTRGFDRVAIGGAVRGSALIWIGAMGLVAGSYIDRFVLAANLSLSDVGVATFYTAFSTSVMTLVTSSTLVVASPRLIRFVSDRQWPEFRRDLRRVGRTVAFIGFALAAIVTVALPFVGQFLGKAELSGFSLTLALIMSATWIRMIAETAFYGLYAFHDDRPIWLGNLLFLVPSLALNLLLIPLLGLVGLGIAMVAASLFLLAWRWRALNFALAKVTSHSTA